MSSVKIPLPGPVIKPSTSQVRPTSASGNIQSHPSFTTGLYDKKCIVQRDQSSAEIETKIKKSGTHIGFMKMAVKVVEPKDEIEKQRRRTIEVTDGLDLKKFLGRDMSLALMKRNILVKIEEKIDIEMLEELKQAFENAERDKNGKLDLKDFKSLLSNKLQLMPTESEQTDNLFKKIDWASTEAISWDDFCSFMQLEYAEKDESYLKAREMAFNLPARVENTPHRENVFRITSTSDGTFIAGSTDGILSFWSSSLELKKNKYVLTADQKQRLKQKWIIDFLVMSEFNKIIVGTEDREIEFFELSSFEPYCRIHSLETVPLCLDYHVDRDDSDRCVLFWGDRLGCVNTLQLLATGESLRTWKKQPRSEGIASIGMEAVLAATSTVRFNRWKVHNDWVLKLKYYDSLRQVISCSNDEPTALVIGSLTGSTQLDQQQQQKQLQKTASTGHQSLASMMQPHRRLAADQTVFCIYKGIQTFDFGSSKNVLVTGGLDRIIRLWNPYVNSKPTGMLKGHNKPIVYLHIAEADNRIFSICADKCIKVWDLHDHNCLLTVRPKGHMVKGDLQACHYSDQTRSLMIATDRVSMLNIRTNATMADKQLRKKHANCIFIGGNYFGKYGLSHTLKNYCQPPVLHTDVALSHKEPISCCLYNTHFNLIITGCEGGMVTLWNLDSGQRVFEFDEAHEGGLTCMAFDISGRRLLTGGRDGVVRMWNFNNGHRLTEFAKAEDPDYPQTQSEEISAIRYVEISRNKFIIAVGWDKAINVYIDQCGSSMHRRYGPTPRWHDDVPERGHQDDIISMATMRGQLLATGDYHGTIIVWNLMSGHMFFHLNPPPIQLDEDTDYLDEDLSINKLLFLQSRHADKASASLVASGPYGLVHFWNVKQAGALYARFKGGQESGGSLTAMTSCNVSDTEDKHLVVGDRFGFVSVWDIQNYGTSHPEENCPELVRRWRAHTETVTDLCVAGPGRVLITTSADRTARVWTLEAAEFVGTFGQTAPWDLAQPLSFQHPMVPFDVLIDPRSMPAVLGPRMSVEERKQRWRDEARVKTAANRRSVQTADGDGEPVAIVEEAPCYSSNKTQFFVDDAIINKMVAEKAYSTAFGKRLKYERIRSKNTEFDDGGPHEYRSLGVFSLADPPPMNQPDVINRRDDPFQFLNWL